MCPNLIRSAILYLRVSNSPSVSRRSAQKKGGVFSSLSGIEWLKVPQSGGSPGGNLANLTLVSPSGKTSLNSSIIA